jgi:hypothetical protein
MVKNQLRKLIVILITVLFGITWVSYSLSFEWNIYQKHSFPNFTIFSQFLAAMGAILAVMIALFLNNIQKYLAKTDVCLEDNKKFDRNYEIIYDVNNLEIPLKIRYFLHLKIINTNTQTTLKDCILYLLPQNKIGDYTLDSPRPFKFAGYSVNDRTVKNITHEDYIDLAFIDIDLQESELKPKLSVVVNNHTPIDIDLQQHKTLNFTISVYSPSLIKIPEFDISISCNEGKLSEFTKDLSTERAKLNTKNEATADALSQGTRSKEFREMHFNNQLKGFGTLHKIPKILDLYDSISIVITKNKE